MILFFSSCEDNIPNVETEFSDGLLFSSFGRRDNNISLDEVNKIGIENFVPLSDLSKGIVEREWAVSAGNFLLPGFTIADTLNFDSFIDPEKGLTTDDELVNILFNEPGNQTITYRGVFNDSTSLRFLESTDGIQTEQEGDLWIASQQFQFDVFDLLNPELEVSTEAGDSVLRTTVEDEPIAADSLNFTTVTIKSGESLQYVDQSTVGRPDGVRWTFNTGAPEPERSNRAEASVTYFRIGTFNAGTIRSTRAEPAFSKTELIPLRVNVVQTDLPLERVGSVLISTDDVITIQASGLIGTISDAAKDFFTVSVTNEDSGLTTPIEIPVKRVSVNSQDATKINITLEQEIYNTDTVSISFSGSGTDFDEAILSIDQRNLQEFLEEPARFQRENILPATLGSFEGSNTNEARALLANYFAGGWNRGNLFLSRSTTRFSDGEASLLYNANPSVDRNNIRILTSPINNNDVYKNLFIAPGKYLVALDVYKEPGTTMQKFRTRGRGGELANNLVWDIENIAEGEWVTLAQEVEYLKVPTTWFFEFIGADNPDAVGMQTFYVDNWRLSANETRP